MAEQTNEPPFVVLKFLNKSEDDHLYEVGLSKWLLDVDENMNSLTYWPPNNLDSGSLIRKERDKDTKWTKHAVLVKRYFADYLTARRNVKGIIDRDESNYESEVDLGRGKRGRKRPKRILSSSDSESDERQSVRKPVPAPPKMPKPDFVVAKPGTSDQNPKPKTYSVKIGKPGKAKEKSNPVLQKVIDKKNDKDALVERILASRKKAAERVVSQKTAQANFQKLLESSQAKQDKKLQVKSNAGHLQNSQPEAGKKLTPKKVDSQLTSPRQIIDDEPDLSPKIIKVASRSSFTVTPKKSVDLDSRSVQISPDPAEKVNSGNGYGSLLQTPPKDAATDDIYDSLLRDTDPVKISPPKESSPTVSTLKRYSPLSSMSNDRSYSRALFTSPPAKQSGHQGIDRDTKLQLNRVERRLEEVSSKVDTVIMNQAKLNRQLLPPEIKFQKPHNMPPLPLYTKDDLATFETWLSEETNLDAMADYLSSFSLPSNEGAAASKIMSKVMANCLGKHYNFDGNGFKDGLKHLKLWVAIQGALAIKFLQSDQTEALASVREWLRNAPGRKQEDKLRDESQTQISKIRDKGVTEEQKEKKKKKKGTSNS